MYERKGHHFPFKRFFFLSALIGAGVYYLSREQNRKMLDQKLTDLGLKDAAGNIESSLAKGWEKTKDAATSAGSILADKVEDVKDAVQQGGGALAGIEAAKDAKDEAQVAVKGAASEAKEAAQQAATNVSEQSREIKNQAKNKVQEVTKQVQKEAKDLANEAHIDARDLKKNIQQAADSAQNSDKDSSRKKN